MELNELMKLDTNIWNETEFGHLDYVEIDGKYYFPASDRAKVLGYHNPRKAIIDHCDEPVRLTVPHPQSPSKTIVKNFITESDLYSLIFNSRLPIGKQFHDWICDDVLPSIRKYGYYITPKLRAECGNDPEKIKAKLHQIALQQFVDYCTEHPDEAVDMMETMDKHPPETKYKLFCYIAMSTGMRKGEILGLEWKNIELDTGVIHVVQAAKYNATEGMHIGPPKTEKGVRVVRVPADVVELLKLYKKEQAQYILDMGDKWIGTDFLFTQHDGSLMSIQTPYEWLREYCAKYGLTFKAIHSMRHYVASAMILSHMEDIKVSRVLGHAQVSTTVNTPYGHTRKTAAISDIKERRFNLTVEPLFFLCMSFSMFSGSLCRKNIFQCVFVRNDNTADEFFNNTRHTLPCRFIYSGIRAYIRTDIESGSESDCLHILA